LTPLKKQIEEQDEAIKRQFITDNWQQDGPEQRFVFNKLMTPALSMGVSQNDGQCFGKIHQS